MSEPGLQPLREELKWKRIVDFTEEELIEAGFKGEGVPPRIVKYLNMILAKPELVGFVKGLTLHYQLEEELNPKPAPIPQARPSNRNFSDVPVPTSPSALTLVGDNLVTDFEKHHYYVGLCANDDEVPLLYYRTNLDTAPFPLPSPGDRFFRVANKTVCGGYHPVLARGIWGTTVGPAIINLLDETKVGVASLTAVRFSWFEADDSGTGEDKPVSGPLVVWISTRRGRNTPARAREVSPAILKILADHGVTDAEVEWYESRFNPDTGTRY